MLPVALLMKRAVPPVLVSWKKVVPPLLVDL
jgi:hypothetical protein